MNRTFDFLKEHRITVVKISGHYNFAQGEALLSEASLKIKATDSRGSLWDFRDAEVTGRLVTLYERPELYQKIGLLRSVKKAVLLNELNEEWNFLETVCFNRGWNVRLFTDYLHSIDWLVKN